MNNFIEFSQANNSFSLTSVASTNIYLATYIDIQLYEYLDQSSLKCVSRVIGKNT